MGAVIDRRRSQDQRLSGRRETNARVLQGGTATGDGGYFIEPTLIETDDPGYRTDVRGDFGPVVTAYVYPRRAVARNARRRRSHVARTRSPARCSPRSRGRAGSTSALRNAAGNFYINDKPTGAVVGQQPFGGARGSGTNDKAGSKLNLVRWVSARTVKETFAPPRDYKYPFMAEECSHGPVLPKASEASPPERSGEPGPRERRCKGLRGTKSRTEWTIFVIR